MTNKYMKNAQLHQYSRKKIKTMVKYHYILRRLQKFMSDSMMDWQYYGTVELMSCSWEFIWTTSSQTDLAIYGQVEDMHSLQPIKIHHRDFYTSCSLCSKEVQNVSNSTVHNRKKIGYSLVCINRHISALFATKFPTLRIVPGTWYCSINMCSTHKSM